MWQYRGAPEDRQDRGAGQAGLASDQLCDIRQAPAAHRQLSQSGLSGAQIGPSHHRA